MSSTTPAIRPHVEIVNGQPLTHSLKIAEHFGKNHKDVLRAIEQLDCSPAFRERNFAPTSASVPMPNGGHRQIPAYTITRDGFTFLVMGFTGKEAAQWKEAYIEAFNRMEASLYSQPPTPPPAPTGRPVHPWFPLVQQYLHQRLHAVPPAERRRLAVLTDDLVRGIGLEVEQVSIGDRMRIAAMTRELGWEAIQVRPDRHSRSRAYRPTIALLTRTGALGTQAALPPPEPEPSSNACQLPLLIAAEPGTRFLVSIGADGQSTHAQPVPPDCAVMTTRQFLQALVDQNGLCSHPVETPLLFDVIERLQGIIRGRCYHLKATH